ncbi:hypothetical protein SLEP1_g17308 [Rubroshorea leprosula]|uniref:CASP-like protein n=1 Tax=Rubroshorea leprosula TaxID=152421 RepID=A0AAV5J4D3_9ROSI|nr:hypothetical protein SLEP1_g17308 [Rubroshorea leprosula]
MGSKPVETSTLVLRIFTFFFAVASFVDLLTNKIESFGGGKLIFKDIITYSYVFSTAVIAAAYALLQISFAIYNVNNEKRMISSDFSPEFDIYADKPISLLLATGVGAGFAVTYEFKQFLNGVFDIVEESDLKPAYDKFLNKV